MIAGSTATMFLSTVSCTKDDVISAENTDIEDVIQVKAMMSNGSSASTQTKSSDIIITDLEHLTSFKMWIQAGEKMVADGTIFNKPASSTGLWSDGNIYYWNSTDNYSFIGTAVNNAAASIEGATVQNGKISISNYSVTTGNITASDTSSKTQEDPIVATTTGNSAGQITQMTFYHALSRVRVKASYSADSNVKLSARVLGYEFRGVGVKGSVSSSDSALNLNWTVAETGNVTDLRYTAANAPEPEDYDSANISWCNVIPGSVANSLVVRVAFFDSNNVQVGTDRFLTASGDALKTTSGLQNYAQGYQYTYNVTIKNDGGPDTDGPDGPDHPLARIEIKSISVTAWQDSVGGTAEFK